MFKDIKSVTDRLATMFAISPCSTTLFLISVDCCLSWLSLWTWLFMNLFSTGKIPGFVSHSREKQKTQFKMLLAEMVLHESVTP